MPAPKPAVAGSARSGPPTPQQPHLEDPGPTNPSRVQYPVLDTVRAIGALLVVVTHVAFATGAYHRNGILGALLARFNVGVSIFFVLSGFLLARQWMLSPRDHLGRQSLRYFWKRFLRVYPPYVIGVLAALIWVGQDSPMWPWRWLSNLTLVDVYLYDHLPLGMTQMWSLQAEAAFYVILPGVIWLMARGRNTAPESLAPSGLMLAWVAGAMIALNLAWIVCTELWAESLPFAATMPVLVRYLSWFAVGIALAWCTLQTQGRIVTLLRRLGQAPVSCYLIGIALLVLTATPLGEPIDFGQPSIGQALFQNLAFATIGLLVVIPGVYSPATGTFVRVLSHPWLRHLGYLSYGVFCIHLPLISFVYYATDYSYFGGDFWPVLTLTLIASLAAAEAIYRFVEKPAATLRNWHPRKVAD